MILFGQTRVLIFQTKKEFARFGRWERPKSSICASAAVLLRHSEPCGICCSENSVAYIEKGLDL